MSSNILNPPKTRRHLIYSYFIESTGIVEVFRALFTSYLISDEVLKLNRRDDVLLIEKIKETIDYVYSKPASKLTPDLEQLRWNAYWRLFGYTIKGKNDFPKVSSYNSEFNKNFESIMYEICHGILDRNITIEKLGNANALAELLDNMRSMLINKTYNEIEDISAVSAVRFERLLSLFDDDALMQTRLNIRSHGTYRRLIELGERLNVPVAKESLYLLQLALRMEIFLIAIEDTQWDAQIAASLFNEEFFFKEISSAWYQITGRDFFTEALSKRRMVSQPSRDLQKVTLTR
jgi:hypothetical protein